MIDYCSKTRHRRAVAIAEMLVGMALMTTAVVLTAQMYLLVGRAARGAQQRQIATIVAANAMERVQAMTWDELNQENVGTWQAESATRRWLPGCTLKVVVTPRHETPASKRVEVEVAWRGAAGAVPHRVRLVMWKYQAGESQP